MKLHQQVVFEMQGPVPVTLTLDEVIKAGKVTNHYQVYVLSWLSEFFRMGYKSASLQLENPVVIGSDTTKTANIQAIKEMAPEDQVRLAQFLKDSIAFGEALIKGKDMDIVSWMRFVTQKQD